MVDGRVLSRSLPCWRSSSCVTASGRSGDCAPELAPPLDIAARYAMSRAKADLSRWTEFHAPCFGRSGLNLRDSGGWGRDVGRTHFTGLRGIAQGRWLWTLGSRLLAGPSLKSKA